MVGVVVLWALSLGPRPTTSAPQVQWRDHSITALPPEGAPTSQAVTLPQSWKAQGWAPHGVGRYVSRFHISEDGVADAERQPWSLRIDRLSYVHVIWLNGHLLHSTLPRAGGLGSPVPALIDVPGSLLHEGDNELTIEVRSAMQGGLSAPMLAPKAEVQGAFVSLYVLTRMAPLALNLMCMTFSALLVTLWLQRRQEAASGLFGLLYLVSSVRNACYFIPEDMGLPLGLSSWGYLCAHVATSCLLGWFAMAFASRQSALFSRVLWTVLLAFPLIGLLAMRWDPLLAHTRGALQPVLILLLLPSVFILARRPTLSLNRAPLIYVALGVCCVMAAGAHDYIWLRALGDVGADNWLPWAIPMALPAFSKVVLGRVVRAFNDIEALNANLELKVAERTRELASANAAKSRFLAAASHDLRQPVAAIGLINDLLRDKLRDPASHELSERLTHAVVSMESLLKGLLDLSRLDSGTVEVHAQRVHLQGLLSSIASHESESARHKGLRLRVRAGKAVAWTDPVLLEQILRNLVGNAVHHTQRGGVLVSVRERGAQLLIQVWDTGRGIAPADQARIFEEFVQLGNPGRDRRQGLGLGLAIVQRAVRLMGHEVTLSSRLGRGTCFSLVLPSAAAVPSGVSTAPAHPADTAHTPDPAGAPHTAWRVMLVEDEVAIQEALSKLLGSWGLRVHAGPDLQWARQQDPGPWDLVISDHRLPDGTGRDVVQHLRAQQPGLPALIISGDTSPEQLAQLARSGLPVLHKPFRAETLRAMINSTMALQRT